MRADRVICECTAVSGCEGVSEMIERRFAGGEGFLKCGQRLGHIDEHRLQGVGSRFCTEDLMI